MSVGAEKCRFLFGWIFLQERCGFGWRSCRGWEGEESIAFINGNSCSWVLSFSAEILRCEIGSNSKVQGSALVPSLDQSNEKLSASNTEIGSDRVVSPSDL